MAADKFERVCIIGVGLIGGSLALEAREIGLFGEVVGYGRRRENLEDAVRMGIIDRFDTELSWAVGNADLVVLACPVGAFTDTAVKIAPALKSGAVVTDVGSVKGKLVEELEDLLQTKSFFVGGHPVAGSEKSGAVSAVKGLFKDKWCILTPTHRTDANALSLIKGMWEKVGMKVVEMDAYLHDKILAITSHLPHAVAYALMDAVLTLAEETPQALNYSAGGLHDFTRISASSPEMWRDIFSFNKKEVTRALDAFIRSILELKEMIVNDDGEAMRAVFEKTRLARGKK